jgi:predicted nucleic acid-binding protein
MIYLALQAGVLVSLDNDLLSLGRSESRSLPLMTPAMLLTLLREAGVIWD